MKEIARIYVAVSDARGEKSGMWFTCSLVHLHHVVKMGAFYRATLYRRKLQGGHHEEVDYLAGTRSMWQPVMAVGQRGEAGPAAAAVVACSSARTPDNKGCRTCIIV